MTTCARQGWNLRLGFVAGSLRKGAGKDKHLAFETRRYRFYPF